MPMIDIAATGQNLKQIIKANGKTIKDIQKILGFNNPTAIYKWFRGDAVPSIDNLVVLAFVLRVKIDDIIVAK